MIVLKDLLICPCKCEIYTSHLTTDIALSHNILLAEKQDRFYGEG